ncbi:UNKNOWN [Stylonychia lemnae]|uniref:Uncharacterized protein n=1 Tax=Stylonychia lemnae TaxID=5949 RepID=A0A077ZUJ3_STYLE|nr:UNKNOWN [Stylonychia lemnae]|eukprot:CDW73547.1 UNKNOWN [Stylonychia lemnae]
MTARPTSRQLPTSSLQYFTKRPKTPTFNKKLIQKYDGMKQLYQTMNKKPEIVETKELREFQEKMLITCLNNERNMKLAQPIKQQLYSTINSIASPSSRTLMSRPKSQIGNRLYLKRSESTNIDTFAESYLTQKKEFQEEILKSYNNQDLEEILDRIDELENDQLIGKDIREQRGQQVREKQAVINEYKSNQIFVQKQAIELQNKYTHKQVILDYVDYDAFARARELRVKILEVNQELLSQYMTQHQLMKFKERVEVDLITDRPKIDTINIEIKKIIKKSQRQDDYQKQYDAETFAVYKQIKEFKFERDIEKGHRLKHDKYTKKQAQQFLEYNTLMGLGQIQLQKEQKQEQQGKDYLKDHAKIEQSLTLQYKVQQYANIVEKMLYKYEQDYQRLLEVTNVKELLDIPSHYEKVQIEKQGLEERINELKQGVDSQRNKLRELKLQKSVLFTLQKSILTNDKTDGLQRIDSSKLNNSGLPSGGVPVMFKLHNVASIMSLQRNQQSEHQMIIDGNDNQGSNECGNSESQFVYQDDQDNIEHLIRQAEIRKEQAKQRLDQSLKLVSMTATCIKKLLQQLAINGDQDQTGIDLAQIKVNHKKSKCLYGLQIISWRVERMLKKVHYSQAMRVDEQILNNHEAEEVLIYNYEKDLNINEPPQFLGIYQKF